MGGGESDEQTGRLAYELGSLIARHGWVLLNGGRNAGVMRASATGAKQAGGLVVGILPDFDRRNASPDLDVAIVTGMGNARNVINVLSSDVVIACAGGVGTLSEIALAIKHNKPVILLGIDPGPSFQPYRHSGLIIEANDPQEAVEQVEKLLLSRAKTSDP